MQDSGIFTFGVFVFVMLSGGFVLTLREFRRMGNRDQVDTYPRSIPKRNRNPGARKGA
jgi:hypothetical protein